MDLSPERDLARSLLRRYGANALSFQALEAGNRWWFSPSGEGLVAWRPQGRYRVAIGAPAAPDLASAALAFAQDCARHNQRALFFGADDALLDALRAQGADFAALPIGLQPEWDPRQHHLDGPQRRSLRAQLRRARHKGVRVLPASGDEVTQAPLRPQIEALIDRWLGARPMAKMDFLVSVQPFTEHGERRYFTAWRGDALVGFLAAAPVYARGGWFLEDVLRAPQAPNGTVELLIQAALEDAAGRGERYVTLGLAPLAGVSAQPGPHRALRWLMWQSWRRLGWLYHFEGLYRFKARLRPTSWSPQYLVALPGAMGLGALLAVLRAFAGRGLLSFGWESARRRARRAWEEYR